jgi:hypothetical protein
MVYYGDSFSFFFFLSSVEKTGTRYRLGFSSPIGNREILLAAVHKSPGRIWSDADIAELLSLRHNAFW